MVVVVAQYGKSVVAFALGLVLVVVGALLGDDTLRSLGYGALGVSPFVAAVPNGAAQDDHRGDPPDDDGHTTLGTDVAEYYENEGV